MTTPFADAVLEVGPGLSLPDQGPWTISVADLKQPMNFTMDLVKKPDAMFAYLWDQLSKETQAGLAAKYAELMTPPSSVYKPGPELEALAKDLSKLVQGKCIYTDARFRDISLSGDTLELLGRGHGGTNVSRLNRLLLEDTFQLDITPRPKILLDPASKRFAFLDFATKTVSLYGERDKRLWTADLGPSIRREFEVFPYYRVAGRPAGIMNVGIWDLLFKADRIVVKLRGTGAVGLDWDTGEISIEYHT
jgi:hypothetical protein